MVGFNNDYPAGHPTPHDPITRTTAPNITKEALADIITDLVKQNIIINKKIS